MMKMTRHEWAEPNAVIKHKHCSVCLIIRRYDDKNSTCKGPARLRDLDDFGGKKD